MKLTKADIDKVRNIEGFPIAKDEDIIALSCPPYYTACPNPFIADFIKENGTPYDEATDDYHREPFASDVSEGKGDCVYSGHNYHTKVPHKAIMRYILHYTKPGDIVFDGFCGTGMTGVAAQMCGCPDVAFRSQVDAEMQNDPIVWGARKAIISDLSPAASFISYNYNTPVDGTLFSEEASRILSEYEKEYGWMQMTQHVDSKGVPILGLDGQPIMGRINYTVWSDQFVCPSCSRAFSFSDVAMNMETKEVRKEFNCPHCGSMLKKTDCAHVQETYFDTFLNETVSISKQVPVLISYSVGKKKYEKHLDQYDYKVLDRCNNLDVPFDVPIIQFPKGDKTGEPLRLGLKYVHQMYTRRNLIALSCIMDKVKHSSMPTHMRFLFEQIIFGMAKIARYVPTHFSQVNQYLSGTLYIGSQVVEVTPRYIIENKISSLVKMYGAMKFSKDSVIVQIVSATDNNLPSDSCDYIFTDPPFGYNLNYSELNFLWEAWYRVLTNVKEEAIMTAARGKGLPEYQMLMERSFREYYRVLKPNHWMTVEFHNSKNAVWNAISEALSRAGFIVADVSVINKQQGSFNQVTAAGAVQQDLVISAYKPKDSFVREFHQHAGDLDMAWEFVSQYLANLPIAPDGNHDGLIDMVAERCDKLLFDRMVAYHIMNGIPVPMDAHTFYDGLRQRFIMRDGMFFLPDQVNEYDEKRMHMELDNTQLAMFIMDEKSAIGWLNGKLSQQPMTYQEIYTPYTQDMHVAKTERMPELLDMLKDNFLQDDEGRWYVPDLNKAADLAKLRTKRLVKEFYDSYAVGKGKLKMFRLEAIRAGFDDCWNKRDFKTIVQVGERLPEAVLQEDPALLMYYDNACNMI